MYLPGHNKIMAHGNSSLVGEGKFPKPFKNHHIPVVVVDDNWVDACHMRESQTSGSNLKPGRQLEDPKFSSNKDVFQPISRNNKLGEMF
jgi:hypothetical protein